MKEEWRDIPWVEGFYQVSNTGKIKRLAHNSNDWHGTNYLRNMRLSEKIVKPFMCDNNLSVYIKYDIFVVSYVVASAFIDNPNNYKMVNHKDGDPYNNCVDNLEWRDTNYKRKAVCQLTLDGKLVKIWKSISATWRGCGDDGERFSPNCVRNCIYGRATAHRGYRWVLFDDFERS